MPIHVNENGTVKTAVADGFSSIAAGTVDNSHATDMTTFTTGVTAKYYILMLLGGYMYANSSATYYVDPSYNTFGFQAVSANNGSYSITVKYQASNNPVRSITVSGTCTPTAIKHKRSSLYNGPTFEMYYIAFC